MLRTPTLTVLCLAAAIGCNRSASAPEPVAPVQPVAPRAASAEPAAVPAVPAEPVPPKEGASDAPQTATAAPAQPELEEKPAVGAPVVPEPAKPGAQKKRGGRTREIRRTPGNPACIEMYGTCTPPPDQICTSSALYVDCGQRQQVPSSGEWVHCVCD